MKKQCKTIQAPALAALPPKLHLNCHTPHAVILGDQEYDSLASPELTQIKVIINFDS
jgi:hypothetical protein